MTAGLGYIMLPAMLLVTKYVFYLFLKYIPPYILQFFKLMPPTGE